MYDDHKLTDGRFGEETESKLPALTGALYRTLIQNETLGRNDIGDGGRTGCVLLSVPLRLSMSVRSWHIWVTIRAFLAVIPSDDSEHPD
jgi:hypothetical protein